MNYTKSDVEELTTREMHEMINSKFLQYQNRVEHYNDFSKFAYLGTWIINNLGGEIDNVEDLIGEFPVMETNRELNEQDLELIKWCDENKVKYTITNKGIKMSA